MAAPLAWSRWGLSHSWWLTPLPHRGTLALLAYAPVGQGRQPMGVGVGVGGGEDWGAWGAQCGFGQVEELGWELDTVGSW
jgi:hypothetical protein